MSFIRKLIIVLVGISLALLVTVLLLSPDTIYSLAFSIRETSVLIRLPVAILIDVLVLIILIVLVRSEGASTPSGGLKVKAQGAITDVSIESARDRILRAVRAVPDVISAQGEVKAVRGKADVDLDVLVSRESINLPEKQKEIDRALRQVINKQLGLQMSGKPRVHIRMDDEPSAQLTPDPALPPAVAVPVAIPEATPVVSTEAPVIVPAVSAPEAEAAKSDTSLIQQNETEVKADEAIAYPGTMNLRADSEENDKH